MPYQFLADVVLLIHFGVVLYVVCGLVLVLVGNARSWLWVNRWSFRLVHLGAISIVVVQSWLGQRCPLTTLESWLRVQAGTAAYQKSFIEHWVHAIIFYEAPVWVFAAAYTAFGLLVVLAWLRFPPQK